MKSVGFHFLIGGTLGPVFDLHAIRPDKQSGAVLSVLAVDKSASSFDGGYRNIECGRIWFADGLPHQSDWKVDDLDAMGLRAIVRCLILRIQLHVPFHA